MFWFLIQPLGCNIIINKVELKLLKRYYHHKKLLLLHMEAVL